MYLLSLALIYACRCGFCIGYFGLPTSFLVCVKGDLIWKEVKENCLLMSVYCADTNYSCIQVTTAALN